MSVEVAASRDEFYAKLKDRLGPSWSVAREINKVLRSGRHNEGSRAVGFHPSQIYYMCPKQTALDTIYPENIPTSTHGPALERIFGIGHALHEWIQNRWVGRSKKLIGEWLCRACGTRTEGSMPEECESCGAAWTAITYIEPTLRHEALNIVGHCDGIVLLDEEKYVFEIKTINPDAFDKLKKPLPANYFQVNIYMHLTDIPRAVILYINKSNGRLKEFHLERDDSVWSRVRNKIGWVYAFMRELRAAHGEIPYGTLDAMPSACSTPTYWRAERCHQSGPCFGCRPKSKVSLDSVPEPRTD